MSELKHTALHANHLDLEAKMVDFGGWEMPVQYSGIVKEHIAVREQAGIFDVSHMGEFEASGPKALSFLEKITANNPNKLGIGRGQYSLFLNEQGGTIDDIIVYRTGKSTYLIVVNASNIDKDWAHVSHVAQEFEGLTLKNKSSDYALIALQGPLAEKSLSNFVDRDLSEIGLFRIRQANFNKIPVRIARTGYTGEGKNGFEIFVAPNDAPRLWNSLVGNNDIIPCGLGARDTLRIEASLPLYGHELDETTSPIEAGLDVFVSKSNTYIGADVIQEQRTQGPQKVLAMIEMIDRGIPRQGYTLTTLSGENIGKITSGTTSPSIKKHIAMAYVSPKHNEVGTEILVQVRNRELKAKIVSRPFFKR